MKDTFLMIDGNSLLHRAFHALPLMDAGGIYTNAIYGFLTMMLKAIADENARYLAVCFDEHAPTFRHTAYPDYKAGRAATPDELRQQFATIRTLLPEMGIQVFSLQGWEADDLLGTLSKLGEDAGVGPVILTGTATRPTGVRYNAGAVHPQGHQRNDALYTRHGVRSVWLLAGAGGGPGAGGDSSDNIPASRRRR
ncbi:MAG: PIN domain-containing protein [Christensenellales bacterium]